MANENPNCELCELHKSAGRISACLKGEGGIAPKLVCYLDAPGFVDDRRHKGMVSEAAEFLRWMFKRMSLTSQDVYFDYILKCYPGKDKNYGKKAYRQQYIQACSTYRIATLQALRPRVVVAMGSIACEAMLGNGEISRFEGTDWLPSEPLMREFVQRVWVTYSPAYALQDPAETVGIFRTLWRAAEAAGLSPKLNTQLEMYNYGV